jgi:putative transposase
MGTKASYCRPIQMTICRRKRTGARLELNWLLPGEAFGSLEEAHLEVAYYFDTYFGLDRRHSGWSYYSPEQVETYLLHHLL